MYQSVNYCNKKSHLCNEFRMRSPHTFVIVGSYFRCGKFWEYPLLRQEYRNSIQATPSKHKEIRLNVRYMNSHHGNRIHNSDNNPTIIFSDVMYEPTLIQTIYIKCSVCFVCVVYAFGNGSIRSAFSGGFEFTVTFNVTALLRTISCLALATYQYQNIVCFQSWLLATALMGYCEAI